MKRLILTTLALFLSLAVSASPMLKQCAPTKDSTVEYMRCLDSKTEQLNNQILAWSNSKIFELEEMTKSTGRSGALTVFKKSQKSFTQYLEQNCRWQYLILLPDTTSSAIKYKECIVEMSEQRIIELKKLATPKKEDVAE